MRLRRRIIRRKIGVEIFSIEGDPVQLKDYGQERKTQAQCEALLDGDIGHRRLQAVDRREFWCPDPPKQRLNYTGFGGQNTTTLTKKVK
jgi:hypothetical protein